MALRSRCWVWCDGPMFICGEVRLDVGSNAAQARLANLAHRWPLRRASDDAYHYLGSGLVRVCPLAAAPGRSKLVSAVQFTEMTVREDSAAGAMRREATGPGGELFAALNAGIKLTRTGDEATVPAVSGVYRPPFPRWQIPISCRVSRPGPGLKNCDHNRHGVSNP